MMTCHSIEGHPREDLEIFSSDNPMSPVHRQLLVTPDGGRTGINLLFLLRRQMRYFGNKSRKSSIEVEGKVVLVVSALEATGVIEVSGIAGEPLPVMRIVFFPIFDSGSSFFTLILAYMSLLNR